MKSVLLAIKQLLLAAKNTEESPLSVIKRIYIGDPITIHENVLPAIVIHPRSTTIAKRGTKYDSRTNQVEIRVIYNAKSYFGFEKKESEVNIQSCFYESGIITFDVLPGHNVETNDPITIGNCLPRIFNGTYSASEVSTTEVKVSKDLGADPISGTLNGKIRKSSIDEVFVVKESIGLIEDTNVSGELIDNTVCGVITKNNKLPLILDTGTIQTSDNVEVQSIEYVFDTNNRPFPSYEVIVSIATQKIYNR